MASISQCMKMKAYIGVISIIIAIVILNAINGLSKQVHMLVGIHTFGKLQAGAIKCIYVGMF